MRELQLRLGIDHTPYPLMYPPLDYRQYSQLLTVKLNQINSIEVLRTIGRLLNSVRRLKHFYIDADPDCNLKFSTTLDEFPKDTKLPLSTMYATGFSDYRASNGDFWNLFFPNTLCDLTLEAGHTMTAETVSGFWRSPPTFQHCLRRFSTNLIDSSLVDFLSSCRYLDTLMIQSCNEFTPDIDYHDLMDAVKRPGRSIRCLAFYPQGRDEEQFQVSTEEITVMRAQCPHLEEVAFGLGSEDLVSREHLSFSSIAYLPFNHEEFD